MGALINIRSRGKVKAQLYRDSGCTWEPYHVIYHIFLIIINVGASYKVGLRMLRKLLYA